MNGVKKINNTISSSNLYATDQPTYPWKGEQTIPREVFLKDSPEGIRLAQRPIEELKILREDVFMFQELSTIQVSTTVLELLHWYKGNFCLHVAV